MTCWSTTGTTIWSAVPTIARSKVAPSPLRNAGATPKDGPSAGITIAAAGGIPGVAKFVKSNAIVYAHQGQTVGVGAGQMSRVVSARIAAWKAEDAGLPVTGAAMASDAFFPFRDGIDIAAEYGIGVVIQPGGSMRDGDVVAACDEYGMVMVMNASFNGLGHPMPAVVISVARIAILYVPLALIGSHFFGVAGIFGGYAIANVVSGIGAYAWAHNTVKNRCAEGGRVAAAPVTETPT